MDIALDPGHSSWDVGATGGGLREYESTLDLGRRTRRFLEDRGFSVTLTREDHQRVAAHVPSDTTQAIRVEQEARHAAAGPATVYVSLHHNGHPDRSLRGIETYYNADNFGAESRRLASLIQSHTFAALTSEGYAVRDRGVREDLTAGKPYGHFFSLRGPFPSALAELLFMSNLEDVTLLHQETARDLLAQGVALGIAEFMLERGCTPASGPDTW